MHSSHAHGPPGQIQDVDGIVVLVTSVVLCVQGVPRSFLAVSLLCLRDIHIVNYCELI